MTRKQTQASTTDRREQMERLGEQLTAAVAAIQSSDDFQRYLRVQARFHSYSARNVLLIQLQRPDATRVAGYQRWQELGRQVRKGEKGIRICAPVAYRAKDGQEEDTRIGFRSVAVFDISQTDGEELPDFDVEHLVGEDGVELYRALAAVTAARGLTLTHDCPPGCEDANGVYSASKRRIYIKELSQLQMVETLAHELGHAFDDELAGPSDAEVETVAEGVAYLVLAYFGLDSGAFSFRYVAAWNADQDGRAMLLRCMQRIQRIAATIIDQATTHLDPEAAAQLDRQPAELELTAAA